MEKEIYIASTFSLSEVPELLEHLNENTTPAWGSMNAQQMVEHLISSIRISNGKTDVAKVPLLTPEEQLPAYREFLFSDRPFNRNTPNPLFDKGIPPLRAKDLDTAKARLVEELNDFFTHFEENPEKTIRHPFFGDLDFAGWQAFQRKHIAHHFSQFGLV
ncbi:MAG: DUF1569 domain-containing protein [Hymenobacteraceae bacterium]|nr:DUF1569 domain-containing protein [Hymenobacteraceae bacterium]MDX5395592.1 DUF1569 domain-containing protein [Hymenobacteraceae bacterium]MDX5443456.1 DUF1569 domain-containing protein [Hymenobacteraceae bacterium]MDX5511644.1 DUF1569 domain-containing protein [Hymenobacteraceae bacterium]